MLPEVHISIGEIIFLTSVMGSWFVFWILNLWAMRSPEYKNRRIY